MVKAAKVTRRQVADAAGVSVTTVTHALNPPPGVRMEPTTRERVCRVAEELGYRPSFIGRALVSGNSYAIGLLQPAHSSVYFSLYQSIMVGMAKAMEADDYHLLILFRSPSRPYLKVIRQGRVDGMVVLQSDLDTDSIDRIIASGIPTVVVNKRFDPPADAPVGSVSTDHGRLLQDVIAEFAALGCRSILEIIDPRTIDANIAMHEAFLREMARRAPTMAGLSLNPLDGDPRPVFRQAAKARVDWDGVFVDGAALADLFLEEAAAAGFRVGRDFQLITSDIVDGRATRVGAERAAYTQQGERVGQEAWRMLRALIRGEKTERVVRVPYRRHAVSNDKQGR